MVPTTIIAFREFLEAFLITGVFWGLSKSLKLDREKEIAIAAFAGFGFSFVIAISIYLFGDHARMVFTEEHAELLESYLQIFSGVFLAYVIFSLHKVLHKNKMRFITTTTNKLKQNAFDISLFMTIFFLVSREGFEIALFTASTSLFALFLQNVIGLIIGFIGAGIIGIATCVAYLKIPVTYVFRVTEYMIMVLGAALVQNGITTFVENYWHITLGNILPLSMFFLPDHESVLGHAMQTFIGIDQSFSIVRLAIMGAYIAGVYWLFFRKKPVV